MNVGEILTQLRLELSDTVATVATSGGTTVTDALWSDTQLINYLNWAEREFVSRTECLRDVTSTLTQVPLVAGQQLYSYDSRILSILSIGLNAPAGVPVVSLWPMTYSEIDPGVRGDLAGVDVYSPAVLYNPWGGSAQPIQTQVPKGWAADQATGMIAIWPLYNGNWPWSTTPQLNLRVTRLPLNPMSANIQAVTPETPNQYHLALVWGAAWQALLMTDVDGYSPAQAASFQQRFEMEILSARRDMNRRYRKRAAVITGSMGSW